MGCVDPGECIERYVKPSRDGEKFPRHFSLTGNFFLFHTIALMSLVVENALSTACRVPLSTEP